MAKTLNLTLGMDSFSSSKLGILRHDCNDGSIAHRIYDACSLSNLEVVNVGIVDTGHICRRVLNIFQNAYIFSEKATIGSAINKIALLVVHVRRLRHTVKHMCATAVDRSIDGNLVILLLLRSIGRTGTCLRHHTANHRSRGLLRLGRLSGRQLLLLLLLLVLLQMNRRRRTSNRRRVFTSCVIIRLTTSTGPFLTNTLLAFIA